MAEVEPQDRIDTLQAERYGDAQHATREAAVRQALGHLDPHADDGQQPYPELLRRLHDATGRELDRLTAPGA